MVENDRSHSLGRVDILVNNAGIQHRRADRGIPGREVGRDPRHQPVVRLPHDPRGVAGHEAARLGPHHQHRLGARPRRLAVQVGLCRGQARHARPHQGDGARDGAEHGITCNAICPGYVWTPLVEKQIDDQAKAHGIPREQVIRDVLLAQQPNKRFATVEEIGALTVFLCTRRRAPRSPAPRCRSTAAGPPTERQGATHHGRHDIRRSRRTARVIDHAGAGKRARSQPKRRRRAAT